jgi:hypothetical protein
VLRATIAPVLILGRHRIIHRSNASRGRLLPVVLSSLLVALLVVPRVSGQELPEQRYRERSAIDQGRPAVSGGRPVPGSFQFVRVEYSSLGGYQEAYYNYEGRLWQRWETDYPQADENFLFRLAELIPSNVHPGAQTVQLSDPELFSYPFIYMCDIGWMELSNLEVKNLRSYLDKGGFLWVDDFWGAAEWANLERNMRRVFPDRQWRDLGNEHGVLNSVFPLTGVPQVPARDFFPQTHDPPWIHRYPAYGVEQVHLRGWFDQDDRLLAIASYNTDIGDGWEREGYGEAYFKKYSTVAYAFGTNVVVYALTH